LSSSPGGGTDGEVYRLHFVALDYAYNLKGKAKESEKVIPDYCVGC